MPLRCGLLQLKYTDLHSCVVLRSRTLCCSDPRESIALAQAFGFFWGGPSNHYWQKFLEKFFKGKRDSATVVQKVRGQGFRMQGKMAGPTVKLRRLHERHAAC